jgi:hypothetical protein
MRCERGQATIEWTAAVLMVSVALGGMTAFGPRVDGRSFGGFLAHSIVCAVKGGCDAGDDQLARAYGDRDAALVREYAPNLVYERGSYSLPVDYRECREHRCSDAPDDPDLDAHLSTRTGTPATAFTHVTRRDGETFIQYWFYYPDSNSTVAGSKRLWSLSPGARLATKVVTGKSRYPGFHPDDWEGYQVRIDASGRVRVRATSHRGYQWCKQRRCKNRWGAWTGWTRVSRGSHAGHIPLRSWVKETRLVPDWPPVRRRHAYAPLEPGRDLHERTTTGEGLRLVPIETLDTSSYEPLDEGIKPPWEKGVYEDPLSDSTS